ncbi:sugar transporter [Actinoplanes sp. NPDC051851]|uniref:lipopolysaccharide biosynthesis protein n=1 Tax=Actinoplanes sp. NPDC051851 TaxID=3154753 RepID=UPI003447D919
MLITLYRRVRNDSLARNSLLIMATTVANGGLGYVYWMLAARMVTPAQVGTATALISAATAVSMVANLGAGHMFIQRLPSAGVRRWSRVVGVGLLAGCAVTAAVAAAGALIVPAIAVNFGFLTGLTGTAALVCAATAVTATTLLDCVYVAHRAGHGMLTRNLLLAAGKIAGLLAVLSAGAHSAGAVVLSWTVPTLLVAAGTIVAGLGRLRPGARLRLRLSGLRAELPHLRAALTGHHLINLTQAGPAAVLPVLVTARLGPGATAHFYLAWMTASILFMVSPAVASALYAERTNDSRVGLPRAAAVVLVMVGAPATLLLAGGDTLLGLFSAGYATGAGPLLRILVLAAVPDAVTNLAVAHWRSRGEFARCRRLNAVRAATCLSLTWLLLPALGVTGAGVAWLIGQSAGALLVLASAVTSRRRPGTLRRRPFCGFADARPPGDVSPGSVPPTGVSPAALLAGAGGCVGRSEAPRSAGQELTGDVPQREGRA